MMAICPRCNKNRSYPNKLCRVCEWEFDTLLDTEYMPTEDKEKYMAANRDTISYHCAVMGQALLELWLDFVEIVNGWEKR